MLDDNILDHTPPPPPPPKKATLLQKLALAVEIGAWACIIFHLGDFFSYGTRSSFHDIGAMFGKPVGNLYGHFFLIVFYLLFAVLIFRSFGWKQHLFAQGCGLIISIYLAGVVFVLESWPFAKELLGAVFTLSLACCILALVLHFRNKDNKQVLRFLLGIFIRMGIVCLLTGFYLR